MKPQFDPQEFDSMRNDPDNYKWGIFYFNFKDPRIIVRKRIKEFGWTLNFANIYSYLIILSIIAFAVLMGNIGKIVK